MRECKHLCGEHAAICIIPKCFCTVGAHIVLKPGALHLGYSQMPGFSDCVVHCNQMGQVLHQILLLAESIDEDVHVHLEMSVTVVEPWVLLDLPSAVYLEQIPAEAQYQT